jgi:predicted alpha/beta hydrolase family esterase
MTRSVLFVQGGGEGVHDQWDDKLVASLERELGEGYTVRYPRMPDEGDPRYGAWKAALFEEFNLLGHGAVVVGHSVGGAVLIHALAERAPRAKLGGIFLVAAPFIGEGGWQSDDVTPITDFSERLPSGVPIFLYHGTHDDTVPTTHVGLYAKAIPRAVVRTLESRDHQFNNDLSCVAHDIRDCLPTF